RATREASVARGMDTLPAIVGTPLSGERLGGQVFDGTAEIAQFPGDLPADPDALFAGPAFRGLTDADADETDFRFLRFRPPAVGREAPLPHIRLDRALQFLIGDRLT
ncbi:MAG: YcjX family protein, partial [Pseudorhodoplanes sp.]|nr:YcjX family protein [Pseudorhodoplanes sp.]